tara:strand:+ start:694 stop:3357 length:2664 start_codon:yes stop_codon:yes gene_type:complete
MKSEIFQPRLLKMLLVNSGRFDYAEIDVDKSMHFHGGNNAGKTTIVNALQFLFVDSFKSMVWTPKGSKETREYYFKSNSYIVFEVSTPTGNQCMVVMGRGAAASNEFQRWVYPGSLDPQQYLQNGNKAKDSASVKSYIDSMNGRKIDDKKMKQWLTGRGDSPFGVAPLKRMKDFSKYRRVFTNLLRMKKLSPNDVRELIISSSDIFKEEITLAENFQDEFDRYKGKLLSINKLNEAKEHLEGFLQNFKDLASSREEYFVMYHEVRPILSTMIDSYRNEVKNAIKELDSFTEKLDELRSQKERARENFISKKTTFDLEKTEIEKLRKHLETVRNLSEIEISARVSVVDQLITNLSIGLERSSDSNLEGDLDSINRKIRSCESQINGNTNLKRELLNIVSAEDVKIVSNAMKMISPDVLELGESNFNVEGIELTNEMTSFLNLIDKDGFKTNGVKIDLSSISNPILVKTVDELKVEIETYRKKQDRLLSAIEAKKDYELKKAQLNDFKLEQTELEEKLRWIHNKEEDEKKFNLINKGLVDSKNAFIQAKLKEDEIDEKRLLLVQEKGDLENLVSNNTNAIEDIEARLSKISIPKDEWHPADLDVVENTQNEQDEWRFILTRLEGKATKIRKKQSKLFDDADSIHMITEGQFRDSDLKSVYNKIISKLDSLNAEREALKELRESLEEDVKGEIRDFLDSFDMVKKTIRSINRELDGVKISDIDYFKLEEYPINPELRTALEAARQQTTLFSFDDQVGKMDLLFERGKIGLEDLFEVSMKVTIGDRISTLSNLGEGESTGTSMGLLLCVHIAILKYMTSTRRGRLPIFIDEVEKLDDLNLLELVKFCESSGFQVITASPRPTGEVEINYWLNRNSTILTKANKAKWSEING